MSVTRYLVTAALPTAREPRTLAELVAECRAGRQQAFGALFALIDEGAVAAFTAGRYGEVVRDAQALTGREFPVFPRRNGPEVLDLAGSRPRSNWGKYWIQLCREIATWLPGEESGIRRRLEELGVAWR